MKIKTIIYKQEIALKCRKSEDNEIEFVSAKGVFICPSSNKVYSAERIGEPVLIKVSEYEINDSQIVSVEKHTEFVNGSVVVSYEVITSTDRCYTLNDVSFSDGVYIADTIHIA